MWPSMGKFVLNILILWLKNIYKILTICIKDKGDSETDIDNVHMYTQYSILNWDINS